MGTQDRDGYLEALQGREDYVDRAGFRTVAAEVDRLEHAMAPWPIWVRSLAQIAFLLAAFVLFARAPR
ncbi:MULTISPECIES: hypothetical protein [unclassified Methylibium]|jgi:hypothetical protein|uniref:hypothetical protein n=1 Tax=unclassified Methylibium TaxID=2633235 RepID=UPI0006FC50F1|nr:hypothetical protein [Methylibium sp. Root1272]KQW65207.1 hypothetical protein ASC67_17375 [Methylibium sp. Root1272]